MPDEPAAEQALPEELTTNLVALERVIEATPDAEQRLLSILERRLSRELDNRSFSDLRSALTDYLGDGGPAFVALLITDFEETELRLASEIAPKASEIRAVAKAIYGADLADAFTLWAEEPDDWRRIRRDVYHDVDTDEYVLRIWIQKYNGEAMTVAGGPASVVRLSTRLLRAVNAIGNAAAFDNDAAIEATKELLEEVVKLTTPPDEQSTAGTADADADSPPG